MKSKTDSIANYNLSYEVLKQAVAEFKGYVLGLTQNDVWLFADDETKLNKPKGAELSGEEKSLKTFLEDVAPRLLDRTTGCFFVKDLIKSTELAGLKPYIADVPKKNYCSKFYEKCYDNCS